MRLSTVPRETSPPLTEKISGPMSIISWRWPSPEDGCRPSPCHSKIGVPKAMAAPSSRPTIIVLEGPIVPHTPSASGIWSDGNGENRDPRNRALASKSWPRGCMPNSIPTSHHARTSSTLKPIGASKSGRSPASRFGAPSAVSPATRSISRRCRQRPSGFGNLPIRSFSRALPTGG